MRILVTGSSGHLGEALARASLELGHEVIGVDVAEGRYTNRLGSICDRAFVRRCMAGVGTVYHPATLHKPHLATHSRQDFLDVNLTGTLSLLEEAVASGVDSFVYTSTTSVFGDALSPPAGEPAAWITEDVMPVPKNIYGVTKAAAEDLCQLFARNQGLATMVLRTSRFFPEEDDDRSVRGRYSDDNLKTNEYLHRRVDIEDVVGAHLLAARRAPMLGFRRYIISATTPFLPEDLDGLRAHAPLVVGRRVPGYDAIYAQHGWKMAQGIDRVYVNQRARNELGWTPRHDFAALIARLATGEDIRSPLARLIGSKGYHAETFRDGPYPVDV
ncbi:NAD-dependent epimerase/dehydratase family protein [Dyella kyungheensis]|uniref:NAD(P)-dependent oxidoreductase n=1 Tax=Dyella kyungheensis TaxID=1242174 RepID=A0ABS2JTM1_9GAMM|nr:NAD(P)-dependent oxidoreductase [Dyella kyungheensis]MBM7122351.1 NAD(P)-dependent oxidoreductase [Dyella kyungheensis]